MRNAELLANRIDRERRRLELTGARAASLIASRARRYAIAALRTGNDPVTAVSRVIRGDERTEQPGMAPLVRDAMVAAHLAGRRRTLLHVAAKFRAADTYKLAGTVYDSAIDFLTERLNLSDGVLDELRKMYSADAVRVTDTAASSLEHRLQQTILRTTSQGEGVRAGVKALRGAFADEGFAPEADYRLEATFRTQTQLAYGAGRWNSLIEDEAVRDIVWGFEYVAIRDDRTTPLCRKLDGMRRPWQDPVWQTFTPPNHWNCRSTTLELFDEAHPTLVPLDIEPIKGFAFNPGELFRDGIHARQLVPA